MDVWILPDTPSPTTAFTIVKTPDDDYDLFITVGKFGLLTFNSDKLEFLMRLCKLFSSSIKLHKAFTNISSVPTEFELEHAKRSRFCFSQNETIEVAAKATLPKTCMDSLKCTEAVDTLVTSNKGIYIEGTTKQYCKKIRSTVSFLPWSVLQGVYWSNFQSQLTIPCCLCCNLGASHDHRHGHCGTRIFLSVKGSDGLKYGITLVNRFYGSSDLPVDNLVDNMNYSMLSRCENKH